MIIRCPKCNKFFEYDKKVKKFEDEENEFIQNECLKLTRRIDRLQYKHDFEDLTSWKLNNVNMQISALLKMRDILEDYI